MTEHERDKFGQDFLERCGARSRSCDVHWPVQLHLRVMPGAEARASGFRTRSGQAAVRRNLAKAKKGYGPYADRTGRSSGSREQHPSYGRSSGYTSREQWPSGGRSSGPWDDGSWGSSWWDDRSWGWRG